MRPLPAIYAPTPEARQRVYDAIYAQGWSITGDPRPIIDAWDAVLCASGNRIGPYVVLGSYRPRSFCFAFNPREYTLVNSPAHLVAYCKTLGTDRPHVRP